MPTEPNDSFGSPIQRWQEAHDLLAATLACYLDSCIYLGNSLGGYGWTCTAEMASRIDLTLNLSRRDIGQLALSTSILAQTRNRLVSPILKLPKEILSEIFMDVVYAAEYKNLPMRNCLQVMHSSLYSLTAVCSAWRNVALTQSALWTTVPIFDPRTDYWAINLSVQRSGDRGLHLATILEHHVSPYLVNIFRNHGSRLHALSAKGQYLDGVCDLFEHLLQAGTPNQLSELSICYVPIGHPPFELKTVCIEKSSTLNSDTFGSMIRSLRVFRLSRIQVQWQQTVFSHQLVELSIYEVKLGESEPELISFLTAISSAIELRDLKLVRIELYRNPKEIPSITESIRVPLPRLQTLLLHDLRYNILGVLLLAFASSTQRQVTLGLTDKATQIVSPTGTSHTVEVAILAATIALVRVDNLLLVADPLRIPWLDGLGFRKVLESVPELKRLYMHGWFFMSDLCSGFFTAPTSTQEPIRPLPLNLELLELTRAGIFNTELFQPMLANIPTQKIVLGGFIGDTNNSRELRYNDELVRWLKYNIPDFRFVGPAYIPSIMKVQELLL